MRQISQYFWLTINPPSSWPTLFTLEAVDETRSRRLARWPLLELLPPGTCKFSLHRKLSKKPRVTECLPDKLKQFNQIAQPLQNERRELPYSRHYYWLNRKVVYRI